MTALASAAAQRRPCAPVQHVLDQHVDEACHRLRRRRAGAHSRQVSFEQRRREDDSLAAHLHGLWIAGAHASRSAGERCRRPTAEHQFVRAWANFSAQGVSADSLCASLEHGAGDPMHLHATCETLRWLPDPSAAYRVVRQLLASSAPDPTASALLQLCARQRWEVSDETLGRALSSAEPGFRMAAFAYCGSFGRHDCIAQVLDGVTATAAAEPGTMAAVCSAWRLGERRVSEPVLRRAAAGPRGPDPDAEALRQCALSDLCATLPLTASREAWQAALLAGAPRTRLLAAAEAANDPFHVPWLIEQLAEVTLADDALSALHWILGDLDAAVEARAGQATAGDVRAWIERQRWPGTNRRWLGGQPLGQAGVFDTLLHGPLRFRHHAARYLAMVSPGSPDLDMDAPAPSQLQWLYEAESELEGEPHD